MAHRKCYGKEPSVIEKYVMGNISPLTEWSESKSIFLQFPIWLLRAQGAPIFINNPISGIFILAGTLVGNWWAGVNGLIATILAIFTALLLRQPKSDICSGGITFNALLIGTQLGANFQHFDSKIVPYYQIIGITAMLAILSVPVTSGVNNIFAKVGIPGFNFPFNLLTFVFLASVGRGNTFWPKVPAGAANATQVQGMQSITPLLIDVFKNRDINVADYHWGALFMAVPNSLAQIYGSDYYVAGILILVGVLICSPLFFFHALMATIISLFTAWCIGAPAAQIGAGVWGYNAVLSTMCLGGFFYVPSVYSSGLAFLSAIFSTLLYGSMLTTLAPSGIPVIAFPFNVSAGFLVMVTNSDDSIKRVPMGSLTYPEQHSRQFDHDGHEEIPDENEELALNEKPEEHLP